MVQKIAFAVILPQQNILKHLQGFCIKNIYLLNIFISGLNFREGQVSLNYFRNSEKLDLLL